MELKFRKASIEDIDMYFNMSNEKTVRENSYHNNKIDYESHVKWFSERINSPDCYINIFYNENDEIVGQSRIEIKREQLEQKAVIGVSIVPEYRGRGFASKIIRISTSEFHKKNDKLPVFAYIKKPNNRSFICFGNAGYKYVGEELVQDCPSYIMVKNKSNED